MMGGHHAASGAAAWVAVASTGPYTLGWYPLDATGVLIGGMATAGTALVCDWDHRSSTVAHSLPPLSNMIAVGIENASGGHRQGTHSVLGAAMFVLLAAVAAGGGLLLGGPAGILLVAIAVLAALAAAYLVALVSSYRLLVEPGTLRLTWLGGERSYRLVQGKVTRVGISGDNAGALRPRFGSLGWAVGPAVLRGEQIELIRLSRRPPLIVAPTDRGRLAIAAAV
jgi:hypothetical protein